MATLRILGSITVPFFVATATCINTTTVTVTVTVTTLPVASDAPPSAHAFPPAASVVAPLAAPLYRDVRAGDAWVFSGGGDGLGKMGVGCGCFDPRGEFVLLGVGLGRVAEV